MARTRIVPAKELSAKKGLRAKDYVPKPKKPKKKPVRPRRPPTKVAISEGVYDLTKRYSLGLERSIMLGGRVINGTLLDYAVLCHEAAKKKGWWRGKNNDEFRKMLMMVTEIAEMVDEARKTDADLQEIYLKKDEHGQLKPEGFPIEMADLFIRLLDLAGKRRIDLEQAVKIKMRFNAGRPYLHGNKQI